MMTIVLPKGENWKVYMSTKNDSHVRYYWWFMINADKWDHMVNWIQNNLLTGGFIKKSKITTALLLDNLDTTGYTDNVDTGVTALDQALEAKFMELHQTADWYTSKYMFWWLNKYQYDASNRPYIYSPQLSLYDPLSRWSWYGDAMWRSGPINIDTSDRGIPILDGLNKTNKASIQVQFNFSEPVVDFDETDINFMVNGEMRNENVKNLRGNGSLWLCDIDTEDGDCVIMVGQDKFEDLYGNRNETESGIAFICDRANPTFNISHEEIVDGITNSKVVEFTFTASELVGGIITPDKFRSKYGRVISVKRDLSNRLVWKVRFAHLGYGDYSLTILSNSVFDTYNNGNEEQTVEWRYEDNGESTAISAGDPHILSLDNSVYELLPKNPGCFRLLQGDNLIINASTRRIKKEILMIRQLENKHKTNLSKSGCFYNELYINSEGNTFKYSFDSKKVECSNNFYFTVIKNKIIFNNKSVGKIVLSLDKTDNVMMKNKFKLTVSKSCKLSGLLAREYLINSMTCNNLMDTEKKAGVMGKNPVYTKLLKMKK